MSTSVIPEFIDLAPQAGIEALAPETAELLYACGAMTFHMSQNSERYPFSSGAVGITDVEVAFSGHLEDTMMSFPVDGVYPLVRGNVLFVPGTALFETQLEVARHLHRPPDLSSEAELALARMLHDQTVEGVAYGGLIRYWPHKLQFARSGPGNSTLLTFTDTFPVR